MMSQNLVTHKIAGKDSKKNQKTLLFLIKKEKNTPVPSMTVLLGIIVMLPNIFVAPVASAKTNATNRRAEIALAAIEKKSHVLKASSDKAHSGHATVRHCSCRAYNKIPRKA
jgi:hypothetical protein